ncbi:MAG: LysR family transcriptional regulator [Wohlfahrtiimonas sp.]
MLESLLPKLSRMNLEHLKAFHYVAKHGSFTQAAHVLYLTQPAISMQIQGLENALHVVLVDRSRKKISLTSEGKVLYSYTQRLFNLFDEIGHVMQDLNQLQTGTLTIAATAVMGIYYLTPILKEYHQSFPLVTFKIRIGNSQQVVDWVENQEVDLGLSGCIPCPSSIKMIMIHNEPYATVVGQTSPLLSLQRPISAQEFLQNHIVTREKGTRIRVKIEDWLKQELPNTEYQEPLINISSLEGAKRLVINGLGLIALPELSIKNEVHSGLLVPINVENFDVSTTYYLIYQHNRKLSAAALQFILLLRDHSPEYAIEEINLAFPDL